MSCNSSSSSSSLQHRLLCWRQLHNASGESRSNPDDSGLGLLENWVERHWVVWPSRQTSLSLSCLPRSRQALSASPNYSTAAFKQQQQNIPEFSGPILSAAAEQWICAISLLLCQSGGGVCRRSFFLFRLFSRTHSLRWRP